MLDGLEPDSDADAANENTGDGADEIQWGAA